jgi:hypothetical protein
MEYSCCEDCCLSRYIVVDIAVVNVYDEVVVI